MSTTRQGVVILGSTGSIGTSTLNCIRRFSDRFTVTGIAAGNNIELLCRQIDEFHPENVHIAEERHVEILKKKYGSTLRIFQHPQALEALVTQTDCDIVVNALVGAVGLRPTIAALQRKKKVALANKESLVIGGDLITSMIKSGYGNLIPVDSEHSAIFQCLSGVQTTDTVESIVLTASGGPFRKLPDDQFAAISPEAALQHPTWAMGKKITIDAATLMNKGFEVIEAHHLFSMPYDRLRVWIHPQSIIHSLVEFYDGAFLAQLGYPDMELPIQYALTYPQRLPMQGKRLSLPEIARLDFMQPDYHRFPCLKLCIDAGILGGTAPAVVNGANEVAVTAFLEGTICFTDIADIVEQTLVAHTVQPADTLSMIETADHFARCNAKEIISRKGAS